MSIFFTSKLIEASNEQSEKSETSLLRSYSTIQKFPDWLRRYANVNWRLLQCGFCYGVELPGESMLPKGMPNLAFSLKRFHDKVLRMKDKVTFKVKRKITIYE